jgi:Zn-dependent protease with chaperone function
MILTLLAVAVLCASIAVLWWCSRLLVPSPITDAVMASPDCTDPDLLQRAQSAFDDICTRAKIFGPTLRVVDTPTINGYAQLGLNPKVTVTAGIVRACSDSALRALIAHELGHILARHVRVETRSYNLAFGAMAAAYVGVFALWMTLLFVRDPLVVGGVAATVALLSAHMVLRCSQYSRRSRTHEYEADLVAVKLAGVEAFDDLSRVLSSYEKWRSPSFLRSHPRWRQRRSIHGLS